ncbi:MAG: GCN5-related N-acetyltransferase [uncultured bacterium]|nr:MAG: GCN5-related N-acetyltransferase [uncultured bacterium]HCU70558.1 hypothetical protein [Candidatus Moranbacteria bacterium]
MNFIDLISGQLEKIVIEKTAELYCQVWKEPPWNEDFWIASEVQKDMEREFTKKNANAVFALDERSGAVCGFSWGYEVSKKEMQAISNGHILDDFLDDRERYFYIDELGVDSRYRTKGIGRKISEWLIESARRNDFVKILLRTNEKALPARFLYAKLGFKELLARDAKFSERTYWILDSL